MVAFHIGMVVQIHIPRKFVRNCPQWKGLHLQKGNVKLISCSGYFHIALSNGGTAVVDSEWLRLPSSLSKGFAHSRPSFQRDLEMMYRLRSLRSVGSPTGSGLGRKLMARKHKEFDTPFQIKISVEEV